MMAVVAVYSGTVALLSLVRCLLLFLLYDTCEDPGGAGGRGPDRPPEKSQNIWFSSNTGPDPLKIAATKPAFNLGPSHRYASETPFNGVSLAGR